MPYGVGDPLLVGLEDEDGVDFVRERPRKLVRMLRNGELDAALVSSIEAFRRPGYRVAPELGICCDGPVHSVRVFVRRDPSAGLIRTVGLDGGSESSVALLKIFLGQEVFGPVDEALVFERVEPTTTPDGLDHDLVLLIGDAGLAAEAGDRVVHDLGEVWKERTGLPFVFALWLIPGKVTGDRLTRLLDLLDAAAARGVRAGASTARPDGTHHRRGEREAVGLAEFQRMAVSAGEAFDGVEPVLLDPRH